LNDRIYLIVNYKEGERRSHYETISSGLQLWNINDTSCILNVISYSSEFHITANSGIKDDGSYPENERVLDCECWQQFDINNNHLNISPKKCGIEIRFPAKEEILSQDCMEEEEPGIYEWKKGKWVKRQPIKNKRH
jgi:hypothetical protein